MEIQYRDFVPKIVEPGFFANTYEDLPRVVARMNEWVAENAVQVINVETVLLPNVETQDDAAKSDHHTSGEMSSYWRQVVRVWFQ